MNPLRFVRSGLLAGLWLGTCMALALPARAALTDEIQVYVDDLNAPGEPGLQMHLNHTAKGIRTPGYPGETVNAGGTRLTAEFAYGLSPDLEAGLYLPTVANGLSNTSIAGVKLRLKWVPIKPADGAAGFFAGLNGELSQVAYRYDQSERGFELRPILGWHDEHWLFATNPVLDFALRHPDAGKAPDFQPSFKVARTVAKGIAAGIEYYTDLGRLSGLRPEPWSQQQHTVYGAVDIDRKPWNVSIGIGYGLTASTDRWTAKLIFEVPLSW
jgi:hypothetical protein